MKVSFTALLASAASLLTVAQGANPWRALHGLTSSEYGDKLRAMTSDGYRPYYISGYSTSRGEARYNAIFEKPQSGPAWRTNYGYSREAYNKAFNELKDDGFRPLLVQGYNAGGERRYASIWEKNTSNIAWSERTNISGDDFTKWFTEFIEKGYRLRSISGYSFGDDQQFAGVWEKKTSVPWKAYAGLTTTQYQAKFDELKKDGYYTVQICPYTVGGKVYFAGIFEKMDGREEKPYTRYGMTSAEYQDVYDEYKKKGFRPTVVAGYLDGGEKFAAIFVKE
ncbi:uncharacterized protein GIQ15_02128 [Arthroderma uncinatum]|uniref:uncharacterized protein n=1 Tax=Arthroderma uncinatum TaxID=74035 RepID=UPI00144AF9B3|nr:uncharacterized protein GIQ15_02128 [Arthroderma uncinatum]KAF3482804.1 hypothetical protein GIQ15_02128 [Arthroderma uncinatum]